MVAGGFNPRLSDQSRDETGAKFLLQLLENLGSSVSHVGIIVVFSQVGKRGSDPWILVRMRL